MVGAIDSTGFADDVALLDYLQASVFVINGLTQVQYMNQAAQVLTGTSLQQARGHCLDKLFKNPKAVMELCEHAFEISSSIEARELQLVSLHHPQDLLYVDAAAAPMTHNLVLLELHNVTSGINTRRDNAMQSRNSLSRLIIKQLAHEIKNPLGGVRGAAQLLARKLSEPDLVCDLTEYTDIIINEADRLVELVDRMLGPTQPAHREAVNFHRVLDRVGYLIEAEAGESVSVVRDYDPSLPKVLIDVDYMTQAILNLARNALNAIEYQGIILLRSRIETGVVVDNKRHAMVVRIDIQDDGPGIPDDLREQIFYPLVTGRDDGVGLGLAIAQDLIARHDGLLKLQMGAPTTFTIYLPLADVAES